MAKNTAPIIEPHLIRKRRFEMKTLQITETQKEAVEMQAATAVIAFILAGLGVGATQIMKVLTEVEVDISNVIPTPE
jgi:hypothetical protein